MRDVTISTEQVTWQRDLHVILHSLPGQDDVAAQTPPEHMNSGRLRLRDEVDEALQHEQLKKLPPRSQEVAADCESAPPPAHR